MSDSKIVVKFVVEFAGPYDDSVCDTLPFWTDLESQFPGLRIGPLYFSLSPSRLEQLWREASRKVKGLASPLRYYAVRADNEADLPAILQRIGHFWQDLLELAYIAHPPVPAQALPDLVAQQTYLHGARTGIDASYTWQIADGQGQGIALADLEYGWSPNHPDFPPGLPPVDGDNENDPNRRTHGTQVLGVICAQDNGELYKGAAWAVGDVRRVSVRRIQAGGAVVVDFDDALMQAIDLLDPANNGGLSRGVMLLELQVPAKDLHQTEPLPKMPVETQEAVRNVIKEAYGKEITVIEAAGNGGHDLDQFTDAVTEKKIFTVLDPDNDPYGLHSRAVLVAAAHSQNPDDYALWKKGSEGTNHGKRIDCFAWGNNVATLEHLDPLYPIPAGTFPQFPFDGTSAAAAMVAGAAVVVQGLAKHYNGAPLEPDDLRHVLRTYATAPKKNSNLLLEQLGRMPDLRRIATDYFGLAPDVYIRDNIFDDGSPHNGPISSSPDVILLNAKPSNPDQALGESSGTEDDYGLGSPAAANQDNYIFVRIRNRGSAPGQNVKVKVYWAYPSTLVLPDQWNEIGELTFDNVAPDDRFVVSDPPLTWRAVDVPAPGHYCFVAIANVEDDPATDPAGINTWQAFQNFIRTDNNATWRNFNVILVPASAGSQTLEPMAMMVPGPPDRARRMQIEIVARLPSTATLEGEVRGRSIPPLFRRHIRRSTRFPLLIGRRNTFDGVLPARSKTTLLLHATLPGNARGPFEIYVRHLDHGREVGRVTWKLLAKS